MSEKPLSSRREFLKQSSVLGAAVVAGKVTDKGALPPLPVNPKTDRAMPTRNLGRTGYRVGVFGLGGQAAVEQPNNEAIAIPIIERALDLGVNYIDTAAYYGGQERWSQRYVGAVMKHRRSQAYLASKTHDRTRDGSLKLLEESLKLLNTDHLDAWQLHNIDSQSTLERIFSKGGAIEALQQAKEQKMVRFLGVTGHFDPDLLIECLQRFPFDQILLALNAADPHHRSFTAKLLPLAVEKQIGIIAMKVPARGRILSSWKPDPDHSSAWEGKAAGPGTLAMKEALYYVLSLPVSTAIIGCNNTAQVEENVQLARDFTPLSERQMAGLSEKAQPVARQALFFRNWS